MDDSVLDTCLETTVFVFCFSPFSATSGTLIAQLTYRQC